MAVNVARLMARAVQDGQTDARLYPAAFLVARWPSVLRARLHAHGLRWEMERPEDRAYHWAYVEGLRSGMPAQAPRDERAS